MSESCDLRRLHYCLTLGLGRALISLPWAAPFLDPATNALLRFPLLRYFSLTLKFQKELAGEIISAGRHCRSEACDKLFNSICTGLLHSNGRGV